MCQNTDVQLLTTHQTGRVVFLLACLALELGQVAGGAVNDGEADHALLHALKLLVNVTLPQQQAVGNRAVLKEDIDELAQRVGRNLHEHVTAVNSCNSQ